jgi:hypothetical protein
VRGILLAAATEVTLFSVELTGLFVPYIHHCFVFWRCRASYEQLLLKYKVDLVFSGHTHAYERTKPVANYQVGCPQQLQCDVCTMHVQPAGMMQVTLHLCQTMLQCNSGVRIAARIALPGVQPAGM